jgi:hypothetical protein
MIDGDHHMRAISVIEQLKERVDITVTDQNDAGSYPQRVAGSTASAVGPIWAPA